MKLYDLVKTHQYREEVKPVYSSLQRSKGEGTLIPFNEVTRDQMLELWYFEEISDLAISNLFNVPKKEVTYRRMEVFKLANRRIVTEELLASGSVPELDSDRLVVV